MDAAVSAIASIPKRVAIPATTAAWSYLNAKYGLANDTMAVLRIIGYRMTLTKLEKADRMSMFYALEDWAKDPKASTRPFIMTPSDPENPNQQTSWTWAEAYELVLKYAAWLKEKYAIQKDEIVAMDFNNGPTFIWVWYALWSLGAKPAFINCNLTGKAFIHCVKISGSRLLLLDSKIADIYDDEVKQAFAPDEKGRAIETVILDDAVSQAIHNSTPYRAPDSARSGALGNTTAMLIYTSGTTGLPKAANVTWGKSRVGSIFFYKYLELKPEDRYFTAMPLYHSSASILGIGQVFGPGCTFVIATKFSPRTYMKQVVETQATAVQYIGETCRYLVSSPPTPYDRAHKVTRAFGNGMRPDVWQKFKDRFNIPVIIEFYGATESPGVTLVASRNDFLRGSVGRSGLLLRTLFNTNVLVKYDHNNDLPYRNPKTGFCEKCSIDEVGELLHPLEADDIKAKYFGYHGNDKASNSKILWDVFKKGDAYYRTGDLQRIDTDGRLWFMDRIGDTFRWKSENVSTAEVSEALGTYPAVKEANVYGVELPNHDGRAGCVALTLSDNRPLDANLARELAAHARARLPRYAVPLFIRLTKEVEVTGTLKHQKVALRDQGVDPNKTGEDELYWLQPNADAYVSFGAEQWKGLQAGQVKL